MQKQRVGSGIDSLFFDTALTMTSKLGLGMSLHLFATLFPLLVNGYSNNSYHIKLLRYLKTIFRRLGIKSLIGNTLSLLEKFMFPVLARWMS